MRPSLSAIGRCGDRRATTARRRARSCPSERSGSACRRAHRFPRPSHRAVAPGAAGFVGAGLGGGDTVECAEPAVVRAADEGVPAFEADAAVDAADADAAGVDADVDADVEAAGLDEVAAKVDAAEVDETAPAVGLAPRCDRLSQPVATTARAAIRVTAAVAFGVCLMPHLRPARNHSAGIRSARLNRRPRRLGDRNGSRR